MSKKNKKAKPVWVKCPGDCGDFFCRLHKKHVADCDCPPLEDWPVDPYTGKAPGPVVSQ